MRVRVRVRALPFTVWIFSSLSRSLCFSLPPFNSAVCPLPLDEKVISSKIFEVAYGKESRSNVWHVASGCFVGGWVFSHSLFDSSPSFSLSIVVCNCPQYSTLKVAHKKPNTWAAHSLVPLAPYRVRRARDA